MFNNSIDIHKMKKYILLAVSAIALAFTSCTDKEEIDIKYQTNINVAVDKLMEPFQERRAGDFDIIEGFSIRIQSYVYDANGTLVQSCISSLKDYEETVSYSAILDNGTYKVVSIADFIYGDVDNLKDCWWYVTGENNINTLKISKGQYYGTWSWETLGAVVNEFEVSDNSSEINVSIKPVTALFQIIFDYTDVLNGDGNGISMFAPYCSELFIHSKTQNNAICDFNNPTYSYTSSASQKETYNIMADNPMETINEGYKLNVSYRAILPQESKSFYWDITMIMPDGTKIEETSDYTHEMEIKAGKQYELYLYIDALQLLFSEIGTTHSAGVKERASLKPTAYNLNSLCKDFAPRTYKVLDIAKSEKTMK